MKAIGRWSVASVISIVLAFLRYGLTFTFVVALLCMPALLFFKPNLTVIVPVSFRLDNATQLRGRSDFGFQLQNERVAENEEASGRVERIEGALRVPTSSRTFIAINAVVILVVLFVVLLVLDRMRAVLKTLAHGTPFVPENAARIRFVAIAVIAGELARAATVAAESYYASTHVAFAGVTFDVWPDVNVSVLVLGAIIFVIAEVFRAGTRLDEEQSLTV